MVYSKLWCFYKPRKIHETLKCKNWSSFKHIIWKGKLTSLPSAIFAKENNTNLQDLFNPLPSHETVPLSPCFDLVNFICVWYINELYLVRHYCCIALHRQALCKHQIKEDDKTFVILLYELKSCKS